MNNYMSNKTNANMNPAMQPSKSNFKSCKSNDLPIKKSITSLIMPTVIAVKTPIVVATRAERLKRLASAIATTSTITIVVIK